MKISASNTKTDHFEVSIDITPSEAENVTNCTFEFSLGISRIINEYVHNWCDKKDKANILVDVILDMINTYVHDYFDSGTFDEVAEIREENELYGFMEDVFNNYLEKNGRTEDEFLKLFHGFDTLKFDAVYTDGVITLLIVNSDGSRGEILDTFRVELVYDEKELEKITGAGYIVGTILGDKLFGNEKNPIRLLKNTDGFADGGLVSMIKQAMRGDKKCTM